jgi:transposase
VNSELFVSSRQVYGIDVIGPLRGDNHWEAKAGVGFAARDFVIDWQRQVATFPHGKLSSSWTPAVDKFRNHVIKIKFGKTECQDCPVNAMHPHNTDQAYHHHTAASAARGIASGTTP